MFSAQYQIRKSCKYELEFMIIFSKNIILSTEEGNNEYPNA